MAQEKNGDGTSEKLATVQALLRTAEALVDEMTGDPLGLRWMQAFTRMPAEDRRAILEVVEREVEMRLLDQGGDSLSGFRRVRPNPNARLYVRFFGPPTAYYSRDEIMRATLRAARGVLLAPPESPGDLESATLDAFGALQPMEREALLRHFREMQALLERAATGSAKAS